MIEKLSDAVAVHSGAEGTVIRIRKVGYLDSAGIRVPFGLVDVARIRHA